MIIIQLNINRMLIDFLIKLKLKIIVVKINIKSNNKIRWLIKIKSKINKIIMLKII